MILYKYRTTPRPTFYHGLGPVFVNLDELLGLDRHLLGNIAPHENGLEARPQQLHFDPQFQAVRRITQLVQLILWI